MPSDDWSVAVFKCAPENVRNVLLDFYDFMIGLDGVKSLHFLVRDRVEDEIVVSFRVLTEKNIKIIRSKINYKLGKIVPDKFAVDPDNNNPLNKYVAWNAEERISKFGPKKFSEFCELLSKMSGLVIQMLRNEYFSSPERVEIAHMMSWMLGCTEYGLMSPDHWEIGYYDRLDDRSRPYLKQNFPRNKKLEA